MLLVSAVLNAFNVEGAESRDHRSHDDLMDTPVAALRDILLFRRPALSRLRAADVYALLFSAARCR